MVANHDHDPRTTKMILLKYIERWLQPRTDGRQNATALIRSLFVQLFFIRLAITFFFIISRHLSPLLILFLIFPLLIPLSNIVLFPFSSVFCRMVNAIKLTNSIMQKFHGSALCTYIDTFCLNNLNNINLPIGM